MRNRNLLKWAAYAVSVLLLAVLQGTPHFLPRVLGMSPVYLLPFLLAIAMFEGETAGGAFAVFGGLLWDIEAGRTFGFNALFLMAACIAVGLLVKYLFRNTIMTAVLLCIGVLLLHECLTWFFFAYLMGDERFPYEFLHIILPTVLYTLPFMFPLYYLARWISRQLTAAN